MSAKSEQNQSRLIDDAAGSRCGTLASILALYLSLLASTDFLPHRVVVNARFMILSRRGPVRPPAHNVQPAESY